MASTLSWFSSAFLVLIAMAFVVQLSHAVGEGSVPPKDCPKACGGRCSATQYKNRCLKICNHCCKKCLCVPSGTYGHKDECPCYRDWKTKKGKPKCP
ncbi:hypothetical protein K2173_009374 [Erythroxylum novogranatense]|uniref:Uncharacterized protein n=1 Tax=Erythroxylum novogranatense TaxID=1862640 RepID=A0AAV8U7X4_9ROSI|nr:hypothetical protein K2173_009374 [Erythroxylum novogranatense]